MWLVQLWNAHKLGHDEYEVLSANFRSGHDARMRELAAVRRSERAQVVREHIARELEAVNVAQPLSDPKEFLEVVRFVSCFRQAARRRPLLVIVGPTGTGKSELARWVLMRGVGRVLGLGAFLEVTVQENNVLDLSEFEETTHAGILLDGVADAEFLAQNREVLQGRPKAAKGGQSSTMIYAYPFTLCRRAVVVTMDLAAANLAYFENHHWLSEEGNVIVLRLTTTAWEEA